MSKIYFQTIKRSTKKVLFWYVLTSIILLIEIMISGKLDLNVYFHPIVSIIIILLLICNLFIIPIFLTVKYILKDDETRAGKILNIFLASFCIGVLAVFLIFNVLPLNKTIFDTGTVKMDFKRDRIFVEEAIWLEADNHIQVYEIENFFFVVRKPAEDYILK